MIIFENELRLYAQSLLHSFTNLSKFLMTQRVFSLWENVMQIEEYFMS